MFFFIMIYKLLKNLLKYAGYEGWARDEGFSCNCFYRIRLNTRKWYPLFGSFDLNDLKPVNLLNYIFHIEAFMSLCAS